MTRGITTSLAGWDDVDVFQDGAAEQAVRALDAWSQTIGAGTESDPQQGYAAVPVVVPATQDWVMPWQDALLPDPASPGPVGAADAPQSVPSTFVPAPFGVANAEPLFAGALDRSASSPPPIGGASSNR